MSNQISGTNIQNLIYTIREQQVMLDSDLAELYNVETKVLNQSVKRNSDRFPEDFMFQLTNEEYANLRSQFVTSRSHGGRRTAPYVFTELGVSMLSSVLRSKIAIEINMRIMRTFVQYRQMLIQNKDLLLAVQALEYRMDQNEENTQMIMNTIQQMLYPPVVEEKKNKMGFAPKEKNS